MSNQLQLLVDIEAIKSLKARYFRAMDCKDWDELSNCFTEDLVADFREAPGMLAQGRENYMSQLTEILKEASTIHHGHMPEIEVIDRNNATGIWAMEDIVKMPGLSMQGWGHYHETYRRELGVWKIARIKLTRLRLLQNGEEQTI
jgi:ketosteroid isomerase-like protein